MGSDTDIWPAMLNLVLCICAAFNVFQIKQMGFLLSNFVHGLRAREKEVCKRSLSLHVINKASMPIHLHRPIHVMYWAPLEHTCTETLLLQNLNYPKPAGPRSAIGRASEP